jgi:hypothetical protein
MSTPYPLPYTHILSTLHAFTHISYTRTFLLTLHRLNFYYCSICSLSPFPTLCSLTCPLLRPTPCPPSRICLTWLSSVVRDQQLYRVLIADIRRYGRDASVERVKMWEDGVEKLRAAGLTETEKRMEGGWKGFEIEGTVGMDLGWVFERGWRIGKEEEDRGGDGDGDVAPEVVIFKGVKRQRGDNDERRQRKKRKVVTSLTVGRKSLFVEIEARTWSPFVCLINLKAL